MGDEKYLDSFDLEIDSCNSNYFELFTTPDNKIGIKAQNSIGLSSGFHYYIRHVLKGSVTWETKHIPLEKFPILPKSHITKNRLGKYNYFFNVCAFGYTTATWEYEEWERLVDWMALHGINLPLAFVGQEYIWYKTFEKFGLTLEDMLDFFSGPHFLPWFRMGNIQKWGGPVSESFLKNRYELQIKILTQMRSLGMEPVLPGFGGFIPPAFVKKYPHVKTTKSTTWGRFNESYTGTYLLDAKDPMFQEIGTTFYTLLIAHFGTNHFYNADTFNEMDPTNGTFSNLKLVSKGVYDAMKSADPDSVWVMQGWLFYSSRHFWTNDRIEAYLSSVPNDSMLILDLYSEIVPVWKECKSYFGKPFIWNVLKNFGGHRGLFGNLNSWGFHAIDDFLAKNSTMVGFGITSEAIYLPPMPYEFFMDLYLQEKPMNGSDIQDWLSVFLEGRYGGNYDEFVRNAWDALYWGPFQFDDGSIVWHLGVLEENPRFGITPFSNSSLYTLTAVAFRNMVISGEIAISPSDGYMYDYVDILRQYLSNVLSDLYSIINYSFEKKTQKKVDVWASEILELIKLLDTLLLTNDHFLVGPWIESSRKLGKDKIEADLFEFNARNQITLWGPLNQGIGGDYARKQWSGLVSGYYFNRWKIFLEDVVSGTYDPHKTQEKIENFEVFWQTDFSTTFPTSSQGSCFDVGTTIFKKFGNMPTNYEVVKSTDAIGNDLGKTYTQDIITIANICNLDPDCLGFNSNGWLKFDVEKTSGSYVDLYIKRKKH